MLWHFVSPGLLDILPFGPIMVALLMTGYYHALHEWPVGSTAMQLLVIGAITALVAIGALVHATNYILALFACFVPLFPICAFVKKQPSRSLEPTLGSLGLAVALVLQAASLQWASEPIVYYPFGLLCQFLASAIYVGRRYAAANADNSRLMAQIEQLRAGG